MRQFSKARIIILFSFLCLITNPLVFTSTANLNISDIYYDQNVLTFQQAWSTQKAEISKPEPPDVWDVLNNVTHFAEPNHTVYLDDEIIPQALMEGINWSNIQINLTALYVWDDHNALGPGDIYVRWVPNFWIGLPEYDLNNNWQNYQQADALTIDQDLYNETSTYSIESNDNNWYNFTTPITLFEGWTVLSCLLLEVFEYDLVSADDSLGGFYWKFQEPASVEGYWEISVTDVDIALTVSLLDSNSTFTAKDLTELFQPFLFDNDDTDHTAGPNSLFGRVIHGYDPSIGRNAICIQYLYFWNEVWLDGFWSDQLIHYYDYELVQVYLNFSYTGGPLAYRFVFDNHDEYTNSSTEWRDSMEYAIYEWDVAVTGIQTKTVQNSQQLQPLLGQDYIAHYEYKNLTSYTEHFCGCYGGVASLLLTIETYNHQFAIGRTGGDFLGQYNIAPYNDTVVYACYALLNRSFTQGVHDIEGFTVPNYAPFAYDVLKVFEVPYIHSNYDMLMQRAASFQGSIEAEGGLIEVERNLEIVFKIPLNTDLDLPDTLIPGESLDTILNTVLDSSKSNLTIDYYFNISADINVFFSDYHFETIFENQIFIDFSNPIIQFICEELILGGNFEFSAEILSGMLTIDTAITPQLLGQILNCNVTLHLDEILKWYFPTFGLLIDLFFEDIYLKINPIVSGYLTGDVQLGNSINSLNWDSMTKGFNLNLIIPELSYGDSVSLDLTNLEYDINFQVDWIVGYKTGGGISWLFGTGEDYNLAKWPDLNLDLVPIEETIRLKSWIAGETYWISSESLPDNTPTISSYNIFLLIVVIGILSGIVLRRRHYN
jgi:hypothetical protein